MESQTQIIILYSSTQRKRSRNSGRKEVGREKTFGAFVSSHDLIHNVGGEDDTNSNLTRRLLLLLESTPVGRPDARQRAVRNILKRYLMEDRGFLARQPHTATTSHISCSTI